MFTIIIVTHENLGEVYLRAATHILGKQPQTMSISVPSDTSCCDTISTMLKQRLEKVDKDEEVLILVDLFGATPCNVTMLCQKNYQGRVKIISGLNFPMLLKALTSRHLPVNQAIDGIILTAKNGIFDATTKFLKDNK